MFFNAYQQPHFFFCMHAHIAMRHYHTCAQRRDTPVARVSVLRTHITTRNPYFHT